MGVCPSCAQQVLFSCVPLRKTRAEAAHETHVNGKVRNARDGKVLNMDNYSGPHTKVRALMAELLAQKAENEANPNERPQKSVVFSGWTGG